MVGMKYAIFNYRNQKITVERWKNNGCVDQDGKCPDSWVVFQFEEDAEWNFLRKFESVLEPAFVVGCLEAALQCEIIEEE